MPAAWVGGDTPLTPNITTEKLITSGHYLTAIDIMDVSCPLAPRSGSYDV